MTVAIQVPEDADIALVTELTFTADAWNTPQTVTVTANHDDDAVADDPVVLTHTVSGGDYEDVTAADVEVTITETTTTTGVTISVTALELAEGDAQSYTVVLDTEPAADVTVAIQVPEDADIALDQTELTFTADDWNTPQTVTVTANHDDDAVADDPVVLTHTVSGGDYEDVTVADVEVTITEDDIPGVMVSVTALTITEGDAQSYTVVLDTELHRGAGYRASSRRDRRHTGARRRRHCARSNRADLHNRRLEHTTDRNSDCKPRRRRRR